MASSPFSLFHDWNLNWQRQPRFNRPAYLGNSPKEEQAVKAAATTGIIGGQQLSRYINVDKSKKKKMAKEGKLIRHEIHQGKKNIPIFTLGPTGAEMIKLTDYEGGYWAQYDVPDVLQRLLFFELYHKFPKANMLPAPAPFVGAIQYKSHLMYVYVVRGDIQDLLMQLKWKPFTERMLIVTESLNHLQPLNIYAPDIKARVTTDEDLQGDFKDLFYKWDGGWVKENQTAVKT
ncbi:hypothetical protein [Lentibacillus salinarum]|uniref:Uncharacterized protein n=1 Tax=Lentibacillus salinarum TaxID=446820 RepID=A0ABW3ZWG7_9BACI